MTSTEITPAGPTGRVAVPIAGRQTDLDAAFRLAKNLSTSALMPKDLRGKPSDVLVILLYGQELGLAPMQAIQGVYVVNGRPSLAGQTWLALARRAGHRVEVMENTSQKATVKVTRGDTGEFHTETYTIEQAKRASLTGKDTWRNHPERMLMWRAAGRACTFLCPEIALGFTDAEPEELAPTRPTLAHVAAERADQPAPAPAAEPEPQDAEIVDDQATEDAMLAELREMERDHIAPNPDVTDGWPDVAQPGSGA
ncbi:hypothetical protein [Actinokineospora enzanensis]|uniref:hypothetical protein n=1 Tax=Actinokineospora enzanensis TaxID=155975 RepID=UPI00036A532D|nr:hypothetical protein [Actinokineospora enzanensis]